MKSIVIVISGRGSNMRAIVQRCAAEGWPARVAAVIANRADASGLAFAAGHGIATAVVDHRRFASRDAFDAALATTIDGFGADLVVLAGFMRILGAAFVARYQGRLLNIHPSLLPSFPGLHTHERVIAAGCKLSGATVHYVTTELDHGPIVVQSVVPVHANDDAERLADRVLATEHVIYPRAVCWAVEGRLRIENGSVRQIAGESQLLVAA